MRSVGRWAGVAPGPAGGSSTAHARASPSATSASLIHLLSRTAATTGCSLPPPTALLRLLQGLRARPTQRAATTVRRRRAEPAVALYASLCTSPERW